MKINKRLGVLLMGIALLNTSCDKDTFADINTDPGAVSTPNISYMLTQAELDFKPSDYTLWFYAQGYTTRWCQSFLSSNGYTENFNTMNEVGGVGSQYVSILNLKNDMRHHVSQMAKEEADKYQNALAIMNPLVVYLAIFDTDMYGDISYTEACKARYGGSLTPGYDRMSSLYEVWLKELDESITIFTSNLPNQISLANQDTYYNGEISKWAKFANCLKLAIAARLVNVDRAKALKIAEDVVASPAGILTGEGDDLVVNKGSEDYGWGNNGGSGTANKNIIDFMIRNLDPRVRFFFTKNSLNAEVLQAFLDAKANGIDCELPQYILDKIEIADENGKKVFKGYKAPGEPWTRYVGIPAEMDAKQKDEYNGGVNNYFATNKFKVVLGDKTKTYSTVSRFQEENVHGWLDFQYSTKPGGNVYIDKEDVAFHNLFFSTAEVYLYLAEFKLLGANLPETAATYFSKGVEFSVKEHNHMASLNKIPYYREENFFADLGEKTIDLKENEIATLLTHPEYQLTGDKALDLEKVYIQQYLHYMYRPIDQIVASRRGGIPKVGSTMIKWAEGIDPATVPRRFEVGVPRSTDIMFEIKKKSHVDQNFSEGHQEGAVLNAERVWFDLPNPQYGAGPKL